MNTTIVELIKDGRINMTTAEDLNVLLATQKVDASNGTLFKKDGKIPAQNRDITILIGLGGTGCGMLDYIKGQLIRRFVPGWENRIIFLAIDTDDNERRKAANLSEDEWIVLSDESLVAKLKENEPIPAAWNTITDSRMRQGLSVTDMSATGSGAMRLMGKHKFHNKVSTNLFGYDRMIVDRLARLKRDNNNKPDPNGGSYQAFLIGSGNGGTSSGGFLEMPALISKALGNNAKINGMLFLPDTMTQDPEIAMDSSVLTANGFATLKELDYYMGLQMRHGYSEQFGYNDSDINNRLMMGTTPGALNKDKFFDAPYLIGTSGGAASDSRRKAEETVCEFLISILGSHGAATDNNGQAQFPVDSFQNNVARFATQRPELDAFGNLVPPGCRVNCPKTYGAIGFAESAVPKQLLRVYTVGKACKKMQLRSISKEDWQSVAAQHIAFDDENAITPFRALDCPMDEGVGVSCAEEIIAPLADVLKNIVFKVSCSLHGTVVPEMNSTKVPQFTWENVVTSDPKYITGDSIKRIEDKFIEYWTSSEKMGEISSELKRAFGLFRSEVQKFVKNHGPYAFVNLYNGEYDTNDDNRPLGIREMIKNLTEGKTIHGVVYDFGSVEDTQKKLDGTVNKMLRPNTLKEKAGISLGVGNMRQDCLKEWKQHNEKLISIKANAARKEKVIARGHVLTENLLAPADSLCKSLEVFGHILDSMAGAYAELGKAVETYPEFQKAGDNACEVNLGAVDDIIYGWLKEQADTQITSLPARSRRDQIVDHFFAHTLEWLDIPEGTISFNATNNKVELTKPDVAIPARLTFDNLMATQILPNMITVDIETLFSQKATDNTARRKFADQIIAQLVEQSKPLFNGNCNPQQFHRIVMYPASLLNGTNGGPAVANELIQAAQALPGGGNIQVVSGAQKDSIRMYQYVGSLEMFRLTELPEWERQYETALRKDAYGSFMHGYSPSLEELSEGSGKYSYSEYRSWADYPSPCAYATDPKTTPDPYFNEINREGKRRLKIDETIRKARTLGVLYAEEVNGGFRIMCAIPKKEWDLAELEPENGLYPVGKDLLAKMVELNRPRGSNESLSSISKVVELKQAGYLSGSAGSEEVAWRFATEVLYAHIPMLDEIEKTIPWLEQKCSKITEANDMHRQMVLPAFFVQLLRTGMIFEDNHRWYMKTEEGRRMLANMDPSLLSDLPEKYHNLFNANLRYAYVFERIFASRHMDETVYCQLVEKAIAESKEMEERIAEGDEDAQKEKLEVWIPRSRELESEIARLRNDFFAEYGPSFEQAKVEPLAANYKLVSEMTKLGFERTEVQRIFDFYRIVAKWKNIKK